MLELQDCLGRIFTESQLEPSLRAKAKEIPSIQEEKGKLLCGRCNSLIERENQLAVGAYYCRECLILGRVRSDQKLYYFPQEDFPKNQVLKWQGQLTAFQGKVSKGLLDALEKRQNMLVHAVTGAGRLFL